MKKGFTLVELLAVITVLGIVLAIAIPRVTNIVENAKTNSYIKNEAMVIRAAKIFSSSESDVLPIQIGDTVEISINYLVASEYITEVKNPYNKSENCNGYIIITKVNDNEYDYTPHLKCGFNIHGSSDDGLVAHYKFDDFQEPTRNLFQPPKINMTVDTIYSTIGGEDEIGKYYIKPTGYLYAWEGIRIPSINVNPGERYTFSIEVMAENQYQIAWDANVSGGGYSGNDAGRDYFYSEPGTYTTPGFFQRIFMTAGVRPDMTNPIAHDSLYSNDANILNKKVYYRNWQLEQKPYPTPYTEDYREGIVKDYSGNENKAHLELDTTPRWIHNVARQSGIYDFNGNNVRMDSSNVIEISGNTPRTIVGWINTRNGSAGTTQFTVMASHGIANTGNDFSLGIKENRISVGYWGSYTDGNTQINNNVWYHIAATYDGIRTKIYLNGVLDREEIRSINTPAGTIKIGNRANDVHTFNGLIDDVRIYNRSLSQEEIELLYKITK